jgi:hypothetical protein
VKKNSDSKMNMRILLKFKSYLVTPGRNNDEKNPGKEPQISRLIFRDSFLNEEQFNNTFKKSFSNY